jgi:DNA primase
MDFVEQLKSSVDIVKTIGEHVRLKRVGSTPRYMGLCPFHTEKTPSFSVHMTHQFYKCFGCGVGGDVIKFIMEIERVTFVEALKILAERNGIAMPKREYADAESKLRGALFEMHEIAAAAFQKNLAGTGGAEARKYLAGRGVAENEIAEFGLGLSDPSGHQLTRLFEPRFPREQLEVSGLVMKRQDGSGFFDRFRGRLMFPIHNESGKIIGFGGRALRAGDEPKYMNSPETALYHKTHVLYNLHRAKETARRLEYAVLVEGYMDVIGVFAGGVHNVVASCGTSLTGTQLRSLKKHVIAQESRAPRIVVNFDPDAAGSNAAERSIQMLLDEGFQVRVLELEGELDPDEYIKQNGADKYRMRLENAPSYFHWLADRARARFDMKTVEGRMQGFKFVAPSIQRISDRLERFAVANDVGDYLGVEEKLVRDYFSQGSSDRKTAPNRPVVPPNERLLLNALLMSETARDETIPDLASLPIVERFVTKRVFQAIFAMHSAGPLRFADLEGRLADADRDLLSAVIFADEVLEEEKAPEQARACLRSLQSQDPKSEIAALRTRIKAAERDGKLEEAIRLAEELDRIVRNRNSVQGNSVQV